MNKQCRKHLEDALKSNPTGCLVITCQGPSETGEIQVHMSHHGDLTLLSLLLQGAQSDIDAKEAEEMDREESSDNIRLIK